LAILYLIKYFNISTPQQLVSLLYNCVHMQSGNNWQPAQCI